jgi:hypothetical protein
VTDILKNQKKSESKYYPKSIPKILREKIKSKTKKIMQVLQKRGTTFNSFSSGDEYLSCKRVSHFVCHIGLQE